tara:strand:+ start:421 stop:1683 length:1263 start_codon:yes stop_codon:yes gene_type:complete
MGWKPGKYLKKAFKGLKKITKKIGKGIKKLAYKVMGALGKLGPIGQLALMFIGIPPVIGNFFGALGSAVGSFASSVLPKAFTTAVKGAWGAIKAAGQGVYNTITEAIGNGLDRVTNFAKGKGFTLSEGRTSIFAPKAPLDPISAQPASLDTKSIVADAKSGKLDLTQTPTDSLPMELQTVDSSVASLQDPTKAFQSTTTSVTPPASVDIPMELQTVDSSVASLTDVTSQQTLKDVATNVSTDLTMGAPELADVARSAGTQGARQSILAPIESIDTRTFAQKAKDYFAAGVEGVKDTLSDPGKLASETLEGGLVAGGASRIASKVAGPPPTQRVIHSNIGDFFTPTNQQRLLDAATWNGMVGDYQRAGAYGGAMHGDAASPYFSALSGMSLDVYNQLAPQVGPRSSTASTYGTAYYPTISL